MPGHESGPIIVLLYPNSTDAGSHIPAHGQKQHYKRPAHTNLDNVVTTQEPKSVARYLKLLDVHVPVFDTTPKQEYDLT
jgi:hypothetical protein